MSKQKPSKPIPSLAPTSAIAILRPSEHDIAPDWVPDAKRALGEDGPPRSADPEMSSLVREGTAALAPPKPDPDAQTHPPVLDRSRDFGDPLPWVLLYRRTNMVGPLAEEEVCALPMKLVGFVVRTRLLSDTGAVSEDNFVVPGVSITEYVRPYDKAAGEERTVVRRAFTKDGNPGGLVERVDE